jgi:hypothetical protein
MKATPNRLVALVKAMLRSLDEIGYSRAPLVEARTASDHYRRVMLKLRIKPF